MVYVAVFTGLRVSELIGLRWQNVHEDAITIEERYCRGDWGAPKSEASNATIPVNRAVIERIHRLKTLTVEVGGPCHAALQRREVGRPGRSGVSIGANGAPMRDNKILVRHIKPRRAKPELDFVNWRVSADPYATWLKLKGADVKDAQALMRHSGPAQRWTIYSSSFPSRSGGWWMDW